MTRSNYVQKFLECINNKQFAGAYNLFKEHEEDLISRLETSEAIQALIDFFYAQDIRNETRELYEALRRNPPTEIVSRYLEKTEWFYLG